MTIRTTRRISSRRSGRVICIPGNWSGSGIFRSTDGVGMTAVCVCWMAGCFTLYFLDIQPVSGR
ncbi:MAG: hypothetical protein ACK5TX_07360, partial [Planctomyces sp.]